MANGGYYWVSGKLVYQRDDTAEGIINTIQITDGATLTDAQKFYVRYIVTNYIAAGLWTKAKAIWIFLGGTAATHKWNIKDMRNLDAAFRMTFPNGMNHSSNGIEGNGSSFYGRTYFVPSANLTVGDNSVTYYCNNTPSSETGTNYVLGAGLFGAAPPNNKVFALLMRRFGNYTFLSSNTTNTSVQYTQNGSPTFGCFTGNVKSGVMSLNRNGNPIGASPINQNNGSTQLSDQEIYLLTLNENFGSPPSSSYFDSKRIAYLDFSDGLTDSEIKLKNNIITFAQGILGRQ